MKVSLSFSFEMRYPIVACHHHNTRLIEKYSNNITCNKIPDMELKNCDVQYHGANVIVNKYEHC